MPGLKFFLSIKYYEPKDSNRLSRAETLKSYITSRSVLIYYSASGRFTFLVIA